MTPQEVLARVLPDRPFFRERGGVTLSGGEPMAQAEFALALAKCFHEQGIHVALETCGYAPRAAYAAMLPFTDLFLYDWKVSDPAAHRAWTGADPGLIRENLRFLSLQGARIVLRCPMIPGVNDHEEHLRCIGKLTYELAGICRVDLLPYHALGNDKRMQMGLAREDFPVPEANEVERWQAVLSGLSRVPVCR